MAAFSTPRYLTALALVAVCQALPQGSTTHAPRDSSSAVSSASSPHVIVPCIRDVCTPMTIKPLPSATATTTEKQVVPTIKDAVAIAVHKNTTITVTATRHNPSGDEPPRFSTMVKVVPVESATEAASTGMVTALVPSKVTENLLACLKKQGCTPNRSPFPTQTHVLNATCIPGRGCVIPSIETPNARAICDMTKGCRFPDGPVPSDFRHHSGNSSHNRGPVSLPSGVTLHTPPASTKLTHTSNSTALTSVPAPPRVGLARGPE